MDSSLEISEFPDGELAINYLAKMCADPTVVDFLFKPLERDTVADVIRQVFTTPLRPATKRDS